MLYTLKIKKRKKEYGKLLNRTRKTLVLIVLFFVAFGPSVSLAVSQKDIDDANSSIKQHKEELKQVQAQKDTLQNEVNKLDAEINWFKGQIKAMQLQVNDTQNQINQTSKDIEQKEIEIQQKKKVISELITELYKNSKTTSLEVLTTAQDLSDVLNKVEYNVAFEGKVKESLLEIKELKAQLKDKKEKLEQKKVELEKLMNELKAQEAALNAVLVAKNQILEQTKGQEAAYQQLIKDEMAQKAELTKKFNEEAGGGSTNYPWGNPAKRGYCQADNWGFCVGQCTSYVAWKWNNVLGKPWYRGGGPEGTGDAKNWTMLASRNGYSTSSQPTSGAIMIFPYTGRHGHVAFVESVNSNGTVNISEYNWPTEKNGYSWEAFGTRNNVVPSNYSAIFVY